MKVWAKRVVLWGMLPKVLLGVATLLLGLVLGSIVMMIAVLVFTVWFVRKGMAEQYWEPEDVKHRRHWEDLVWSNTVWTNMVDGRLETPDEGIKRLVGRN
jgi:hypothetical protein